MASIAALVSLSVPTAWLVTVRGVTVRKRGLLSDAIAFVHEGGPRTRVFSCLSFVLWLVSVGLSLTPPHRQAPHWESAIRAVSGFSGLLSFAFMINSILVFEPRLRDDSGRGGDRWDMSKLPSKNSSSAIAVFEGLGFAVAGLMLAQAGNNAVGTVHGVVYSACAVASFLVSSMIIYGLGGLLRHMRRMEISRRLSDAVTFVHKRMNSTDLRDRRFGEHVKMADALEKVDQLEYYSSALSETGHRRRHDGNGGNGGNDGSDRSSSSQEVEWRFWQAFRGGTMFIAMQAAGWVLFSVAMVPLFWSVGLAVTGAAHWVQSYTTHAGYAAVLGVIVIACSLLFFNRDNVGELVLSAPEMVQHAACICILYVPAHMTLAIIVSTFFVFDVRMTAVSWLVFLPTYFSLTGLGKAEKDGSREWPAFRDWLGETCAWVLPRWFDNRLEVVLEDGATFDKEQRYVFGYVPHGLYPLGAAYLPLLPMWKRLLPGIRPPTLCASIVFVLPVLRDLLQWLGLRVVSKQTFIRTLEQRNSLIVVPGGQAELVLTSRFKSHREAAFYAGHKGFIRLALQQGARVCPILCFGEATSLSNFVDTPRMHQVRCGRMRVTWRQVACPDSLTGVSSALCLRFALSSIDAHVSSDSRFQWSYKKFGFPIPFMATGRWLVSPFPSRGQGLKFVIGKPIEPLTNCFGLVPTEEQVDEYHDQFYQAAKRLFNEHKGSFAGYEDIEAVLVSANK